jgi:hypothetical protein
MESACSLSSTHRIVLFGRIFPPGDFSRPSLAGAHSFRKFFGLTAGFLLLGFENSTASYRRKQVTGTPTGGKLCGRFWSGPNADRKTRKKDRLLHQEFLRKNFSHQIDSQFSALSPVRSRHCISTVMAIAA